MFKQITCDLNIDGSARMITTQGSRAPLCHSINGGAWMFVWHGSAHVLTSATLRANIPHRRAVERVCSQAYHEHSYHKAQRRRRRRREEGGERRRTSILLAFTEHACVSQAW